MVNDSMVGIGGEDGPIFFIYLFFSIQRGTLIGTAKLGEMDCIYFFSFFLTARDLRLKWWLEFQFTFWLCYLATSHSGARIISRKLRTLSKI